MKYIYIYIGWGVSQRDVHYLHYASLTAPQFEHSGDSHNAILQCVTVHRVPKFTSCHNTIMVGNRGRAHCSILLYIYIYIYIYIYYIRDYKEIGLKLVASLLQIHNTLRPVSTSANLVARTGTIACSGIEKKQSDWLSLILVAKKVELDSTSRTERAFANKHLLSALISICACPNSPSLGRAAEFAEVETGLKFG